MSRKIQFMKVDNLDVFEVLESLSPGPVFIYTYIPDGYNQFVLISGSEIDPDDEERVLDEHFQNYLEETGENDDFDTDY